MVFDLPVFWGETGNLSSTSPYLNGRGEGSREKKNHRNNDEGVYTRLWCGYEAYLAQEEATWQLKTLLRFQ